MNISDKTDMTAAHSVIKLLILIPTYNEADNIDQLLTALRQSVPAADILVLDDSSPDGTGAIVAKRAKADQKIRLMSRTVKEGLGKAYVAGFREALKGNYTHVVTMDADFSHDPADIPKLIAAATDHSVVIGSRYVPGGKIEGWGFDRYLLSATANVVTRLALGLTPKDSSAGFKLYPRAYLEALDLDAVIAGGYAFQVEMLMKAQAAGFTLTEVPITFVDRRAGESKIAGEAKRSIAVIVRLAGQRDSLRQFAKFAIIGAGNTVVDWGIYFLVHQLGGLPKVASKLVSFAAAATSSYAFNRRWTFRSTNPNVLRELSQFVLVASSGAALNAGIFWLVVVRLGAPDIVGLFCATGLVMFWNFFANKYWTFRVPRGSNDQ